MLLLSLRAIRDTHRYHVEHVREGKSYATRTVQAPPEGEGHIHDYDEFLRRIVEESSVEHSTEMPDVPPPMEVTMTKVPQGRGGLFRVRRLTSYKQYV